MKLTPPLLEQVRLCILRELGSSSAFKFGTPAHYLRASLAAEGFSLEARLVERELEYLSDPQKGFICPVDKKLSPENRLWKITAAGRDFLAQQGSGNE